MEKNNNAGNIPRPSPNGLYLKEIKDVDQHRGFNVISDGRIVHVLSNGRKDGEYAWMLHYHRLNITYLIDLLNDLQMKY